MRDRSLAKLCELAAAACGMTHGLGEERHPLDDNHCADSAEQRADNESTQKSVYDELIKKRVMNNVVFGESDDELSRDVVKRAH